MRSRATSKLVSCSVYSQKNSHVCVSFVVREVLTSDPAAVCVQTSGLSGVALALVCLAQWYDIVRHSDMCEWLAQLAHSMALRRHNHFRCHYIDPGNLPENIGPESATLPADHIPRAPVLDQVRIRCDLWVLHCTVDIPDYMRLDCVHSLAIAFDHSCDRNGDRNGTVVVPESDLAAIVGGIDCWP